MTFKQKSKKITSFILISFLFQASFYPLLAESRSLQTAQLASYQSIPHSKVNMPAEIVRSEFMELFEKEAIGLENNLLFKLKNTFQFVYGVVTLSKDLKAQPKTYIKVSFRRQVAHLILTHLTSILFGASTKQLRESNFIQLLNHTFNLLFVIGDKVLDEYGNKVSLEQWLLWYEESESIEDLYLRLESDFIKYLKNLMTAKEREKMLSTILKPFPNSEEPYLDSVRYEINRMKQMVLDLKLDERPLDKEQIRKVEKSFTKFYKLCLSSYILERGMDPLGKLEDAFFYIRKKTSDIALAVIELADLFSNRTRKEKLAAMKAVHTISTLVQLDDDSGDIQEDFGNQPNVMVAIAKKYNSVDGEYNLLKKIALYPEEVHFFEYKKLLPKTFQRWKKMKTEQNRQLKNVNFIYPIVPMLLTIRHIVKEYFKYLKGRVGIKTITSKSYHLSDDFRSTDKIKILIVDDNPLHHHLLESMFDHKSYYIERAYSFKGVRKKLREAKRVGKSFDRVITDLNLNKGYYDIFRISEGFWIANWVKLYFPEVSVTLHSTAMNQNRTNIKNLTSLSGIQKILRWQGIKSQSKEATFQQIPRNPILDRKFSVSS